MRLPRGIGQYISRVQGGLIIMWQMGMFNRDIKENIKYDGLLMALTEEISLKKIGENTFKKSVIKTSANDSAAFTHYLYHHKSKEAHSYRDAAIAYVKQQMVYKCPEKEITQQMAEEALQDVLINFKKGVPFPAPAKPKFKFIDLFAGIGGFRMALQSLEGQCVYSSEWDTQAQKTYQANFGELPFGDITKEETKKFIPNEFDILCAGFPCQSFSIAGHRGGFKDSRGTLFFDVAEIIQRKQPKAILLENVKGLLNHNKGKTLAKILSFLREKLNYYVPAPQILNAKDFGVPQNRERIFIVGFRSDLGIQHFAYPAAPKQKVSFREVKEAKPVSAKYYLSDTYFNTLMAHKKRHQSKGNGFGYEIIADEGIANAVVCGGMGRERNLVFDDRLKDFTPITRIKGKINRQGIRKMTPREWARLQGFPDHFIIPVADASAYKQFGNAVVVPVVQAITNKILETLAKNNGTKRK